MGEMDTIYLHNECIKMVSQINANVLKQNLCWFINNNMNKAYFYWVWVAFYPWPIIAHKRPMSDVLIDHPDWIWW